MEHKEIFKELAICKTKGMMFHSNMADFYAFLGCCVLKEAHECHLYDETKEMREIKDRFITHHKQTLLLDDENLQINNITPSSWDEFNLTDDEVKQWIKRSMETYISYERDTKDTLTKLAEELYKGNSYEDYLFVRELIDGTVLEISHAENLYAYLNSIEFDLTKDGLCYRT